MEGMGEGLLHGEAQLDDLKALREWKVFGGEGLRG